MFKRSVRVPAPVRRDPKTRGGLAFPAGSSQPEAQRPRDHPFAQTPFQAHDP